MATKRLVRRPSGAGPAKPAGAVSKQAAPRAYDPDDDEPSLVTPTDMNDTRGAGSASAESDENIRGGWGASQETIDSTSQYAQAFKPETKAQVIKLLEGKPYASFRRHWIDRVGIGKRAYVCLQSVGRDCPLCDVGDKPGAVTAFNVAVIGDDGNAVIKSWDCGVKITQQLKTYNADPKIGPLDKRSLYFLVSKTEATQRQQVTTMVNPVREKDLLEDYNTPPLSDEQLAKLQEKCYTVDIIQMTPRHEMDEIAAELTGEDTGPQQGSWGS
jgi:hypothetical protein